VTATLMQHAPMQDHGLSDLLAAAELMPGWRVSSSSAAWGQNDDEKGPQMAGNEKMSYRRAIYQVDDEQRRVAGHTTADADASGLRRGAVVTEVAPAGPFWETAPEHRDRLPRNPRRFVRPGRKLPQPAQEVAHR
jgi:peptide methionine sulfoxide reductase MsrA